VTIGSDLHELPDTIESAGPVRKNIQDRLEACRPELERRCYQRRLEPARGVIAE